jgi:hypothetical protein
LLFDGIEGIYFDLEQFMNLIFDYVLFKFHLSELLRVKKTFPVKCFIGGAFIVNHLFEFGDSKKSI